MKPLRQKLLQWLLILLLIPVMLTGFYRYLPAFSTLMVWDVLTLNMPHRTWMPLEKISPSLIKAVIASEDSAFCSHYGFDFNQLERSVTRSFERDKPLRATSTITQQTAKNLFLWHGRSWTRKIFEVPLTVLLELLLPKKRILEIYLNIAEWGPHIYGAEAASLYHFDTHARNLSSLQAALMAASLPNPIKRDASGPSAFHRTLATSILRKFNQQDLSCLR